MSLYSDSNAVYNHGAYANPQINKQIVIQCPNLCIYGTSTESEYVKGLHRDAVLSGELNRVIALKVSRVQRRRVNKITAPTEELVEAWKSFAPPMASLSLSVAPPVPIIAQWADDEADNYQWSLAMEQDKMGDDADKYTRALWNRRHENIIKIAMIIAIGRDKDYPAITMDDLKIGREIVDTSILYMQNLVGEHMAENPFEADCMKVVEMLQSENTGSISRTDLSRKMRGRKKKELDEIIFVLSDQGKISIEREGTSTKPVIVYKLIN